MKEKMGISIDKDVAENLNNAVKVLKDLRISKSEYDKRNSGGSGSNGIKRLLC